MDAVALIDEVGAVSTSGHAEPVPWWSFSKTVLAIAALRLGEDGAVSLDEPVDGNAFSLRQLLRHEAGLPDYGSVSRYHDDVAAGKAPWPVARLLAGLDADRLRYAPGTSWAYSNIGYLKVAQLIERASGLSLAQWLAKSVFEPAGLATARLALCPADLSRVRMGRATGYHPGWVYHGLVVGTPADAARLLRALLTGKLLAPQSLAAMLERRPLPEHRSALQPDPAYGLGLMLRANNPSDFPIGHSGEGPGSTIAVYVQDRRAAAVWSETLSHDDVTAAASRLLCRRTDESISLRRG